MKRLNDEVLQRGDIILSTTSSPISKAIQLATKSDISHAMVCVDDRSVIDATSEGVQARNTQRLFFEEKCSIYILRLKREITFQQAIEIEMHMRSHIGSEYSTQEAALTVLGGSYWMSKKQFCSRLVAQAYANAGISLVEDPNYCSPADIKNSTALMLVEFATKSVCPEEVSIWHERPDGTQIMRETTNKFLNGVRRRSEKIQTFDDVNSHLMAHPEDDEHFSELLLNSGYLDVWRFGAEKDAWMYDLAIMRKGPSAQLEPYCRRLLDTSSHESSRFDLNLAGFRHLCKLYPGIRYFRLNADLYELLAQRHMRRIDVARSWLNEYVQRSA